MTPYQLIDELAGLGLVNDGIVGLYPEDDECQVVPGLLHTMVSIYPGAEVAVEKQDGHSSTGRHYKIRARLPHGYAYPSGETRPCKVVLFSYLTVREFLALVSECKEAHFTWVKVEQAHLLS